MLESQWQKVELNLNNNNGDWSGALGEYKSGVKKADKTATSLNNMQFSKCGWDGKETK